jgi:hypothetical protein
MSHPLVSRNPMFAATHKTGRLVEAWAIQFNTVNDVVMFGLQSTRAISEVNGAVLICSDYSNLQALPSDVFSAFVDVLRRANPRLDRAALVMPRILRWKRCSNGPAIPTDASAQIRRKRRPGCPRFSRVKRTCGSINS